MARKAITAQELESKAVDHLYKAINEEKPLACVLIATAFIENALITLLTKFFAVKPTSGTVVNMLRSGALSELSKCNDLAYCLGLINEAMLKNIKHIADIRNLFAHSHELTTFDFNNPGVEKAIREMTFFKVGGTDTKSIEEIAKGNLRSKFVLIALQLYNGIQMNTATIQPLEAKDWSQIW
jgi:DNA-binding MltR family transcriptional regulator